MAEIKVTHETGDEYRVEVREKSGRTEHRVKVTPRDVERFGGDADAEMLLRESFRFLLEREPKEAILSRFDLPVIARYFPEYHREMARRLSD